MCGIIFILKKNKNYNINYDIINSISSRGPDDRAIIEIKNMIFMHTRLSIQSLSNNGHQPMNYNNNIIIYNGEIYNCEELKKKYNTEYELDTDFIIKLYDKYKDIFFSEIVHQFDGIFSFIIYDEKKQKIFLCRDTFGIKPLFLYESDDCLCVSSSMKTLLSIVPKKEIINENICDFFNFRQCIGEETIIKSIFNFAPGYYMEYDIINFEKKSHKYITIEDTKSEYSQNILEEKLNDAIKKNMISDDNVKIGCFISGGVDSSYIYKICKSLKQEFYTYSIGFKDNNEFNFVDMIVDKKYHKNINVSINEYLENMVMLIFNKGYLLNVPNEVLISMISEQAKKDGVKVLLAGEGADEIFHGYGRIFNSYLGTDRKNFIDFFVENYKYNKDDKIFNFGYNKEKIKKFFKKFDDKEEHPQNIISKIFLNFHILSLTCRLDSASMCNSIEARTPFLNQSFVKYVYNSIPREEKIKKFYDDEPSKIYDNYENLSENKDVPKYCFKKISEKILPHEIIYRKKIGFPVQIEDINNKQIYKLIFKIINNGYLKKYNIFDMEHIKKLLLEQNGDLKYIIFNMINFEIFVQLFLENKSINDVKSFICKEEYIIGYTCGVFDLFHVGHLNILKRSKELCDCLIVAVTKDDLVSYKGKKAYINEKDRLEIVKSCKYVDEAIYQENHDKFEAWEKIKYDVLFVGDDWKGNDNWKKWENQLNNVGKQVIYIPYTKNISSTMIRNIIM
jgi:asparagine synthase (glutamine-hydrolysing)